MRIRYTRAARLQVAPIVDYIAAENPQGVQNVVRQVRRAIEALLVFPHAGSPTSDPDIRRVVAVPYAYVI